MGNFGLSDNFVSCRLCRQQLAMAEGMGPGLQCGLVGSE